MDSHCFSIVAYCRLLFAIWYYFPFLHTFCSVGNRLNNGYLYSRAGVIDVREKESTRWQKFMVTNQQKKAGK